MWRWWLRIKKFDMKTPVDRGIRLLAVLDIGNFVRRYGFRFMAVFGEDSEPLRYILVTQSKWFHEGYMGMPEEQIPLYPPGECEERARAYLQKFSEYYHSIRGVVCLPRRPCRVLTTLQRFGGPLNFLSGRSLLVKIHHFIEPCALPHLSAVYLLRMAA